MELILIYICLALIGLSILMMVGFGIMNAGNALSGSKLGLAAFALPLLIFIVAYLVDGTWTGAAIATALFTALSAFVALVISGLKSLFT